MDKPSLYQRIVAAGILHTNHYSDLYLPCTKETARILKEYAADWLEFYGSPFTISHQCPVFQNQVEDSRWYDCAFAFDPYWEKRMPKEEPITNET